MNDLAPFETEDTVEDFDIRSFETVLLLVPRPPLDKRWEPFLNDVRERNSKDPINGFPTNYNNIAKVYVLQFNFFLISCLCFYKYFIYLHVHVNVIFETFQIQATA